MKVKWTEEDGEYILRLNGYQNHFGNSIIASFVISKSKNVALCVYLNTSVELHYNSIEEIKEKLIDMIKYSINKQINYLSNIINQLEIVD
jgi:predicted transposase YbfD/YdcC